jgi:hypothetical protein
MSIGVTVTISECSRSDNSYVDFPVIVFCHHESPSEFDVKWYMKKYHRNCTPILIKIDDLINNTVDIPNLDYIIHKSNYKYCTTDCRETRKIVKNILRERYNIYPDVCKYSKIAQAVRNSSMYK